MNDKFFMLDKQKQDRMINAALKIFALRGYKLANTNDISAAASISKGLLFHYFGNKKQLYLYLYRHSVAIVKEQMRAQMDLSETDFFLLMMNAQQIKTNIMNRYPYIFSFLLKAYYEQDAAVVDDIASYNVQTLDDNTALISQKADRSKFRDDATLEQALKLVVWCAEGLMKTKLQQECFDVEEMNREFLECLQLLKRSFYKDE